MERGFRAFFSPLAACALALFLTACGGRSERSGPTPVVSSEFDGAVLWDYVHGVPEEYRLVARGQTSASLITRNYGSSRLSPDSQHIAFSSDTAQSIVALDGAEQPLPLTAEDVVWSPDGSRLAMLDAGALLLADGDGSNIVSLPLPAADGASFEASYFAPDGSTVALGVNGTFVQVPAEGGDALVTKIIQPSDELLAAGSKLTLYWSPDSSSVAAVSKARTAFVDRSGTVTNSVLNDGSGFGWSSDSAWFAANSPSGCVLWAADGREQQVPGPCMSVRWSPTEPRLLIDTGEGLALWSPGDDSAHPIDSDRTLALWSPDGSVIVTGPDDAGAFVFFDATDGSELARFTLTGVSWLFNPSGSKVALWFADGSLVTSDVTFQHLVTLVQRDAQDAIWLPDGDHLAVLTKTEVLTVRADGHERSVAWHLPATVEVGGWLTPRFWNY